MPRLPPRRNHPPPTHPPAIAAPTLPRGWLGFVHEVQRRVGQLVLLTCPTDRLRPADKAAAREVVAQRNALLRQMVAASRGCSAPDGGGGGGSSGAGSDGGGGKSSGGAGGDGGGGTTGGAPLLLLDVDALTLHVPTRATIAPEDYHYQCYLQSNANYQSECGVFAAEPR